MLYRSYPYTLTSSLVPLYPQPALVCALYGSIYQLSPCVLASASPDGWTLGRLRLWIDGATLGHSDARTHSGGLSCLRLVWLIGLRLIWDILHDVAGLAVEQATQGVYGTN